MIYIYGADTISPDPFPIGAVFFSVVNTSPTTLLGYGTWILIGGGRMIMAANSGDNPKSTGGSNSKTIAASNLPFHTHQIPAHTATTHYCPASGNGATLDVTNAYIKIICFGKSSIIRVQEFLHSYPFLLTSCFNTMLGDRYKWQLALGLI